MEYISQNLANSFREELEGNHITHVSQINDFTISTYLIDSGSDVGRKGGGGGALGQHVARVNCNHRMH